MTFEMSTDDKQGHDLPIVDLSVIMTFQPSSIWDPTFELSTQMSFTNKCQPLKSHIIHTALRYIFRLPHQGKKIEQTEKIFTN